MSLTSNKLTVRAEGGHPLSRILVTLGLIDIILRDAMVKRRFNPILVEGLTVTASNWGRVTSLANAWR